ncbi:hypothetical protein EMIHUDRAFT_224182 [Emiliania huxleyi CCMP1516]|uniref:BTB domain-containing protein n=2 Tax=Emiliania huxleyi TaxID=2903 RepID=A0A0D3KSN7_EMIH1|nr:hypothetical protein EMIHUDRAFT_224182 [Emiliania huxleyi CCMP1516]EOD38772.1 hypothetical protein EMIHUDRAFT_224182 [Emiliania huxleyi CCMP1516]|eukprot:XP_005791201.1 hypothetical protein EMIHUDRAFT_224182 [Emiliania huxleyi CCMP1516]
MIRLYNTDSGGNKLRLVEVDTGELTSLAGSGEAGDADGVRGAAQFHNPTGVAISPDGSALFVADNRSHKIRRVEVATGAVATLAGSGDADDADGVGDAAHFSYPSAVAISPDGGALFVTDSGNHKIRRVEVATGSVTTVAGNGDEGDADGVGDAAHFCNPIGIAISLDGSALFVADNENHKIRRVEVATGAVTTLAGSGEGGNADGVGDAATFDQPVEVAISADGSTLLVSSVGDLRQRLEHVSKSLLCARSVFFRTMFGIGMKERDTAEVTVPHTDLASFTALVRYLLTDQLDLGEEEGRAQRALDLRELAQMYQVPRLELLCAQALQESVGPATAVPLLEAAHTMGDGRLLAQCRRYVADHAAEVRASGGVLRDFGVAKGLLGDALDQVAELKETVAELKGAVATREAEICVNAAVEPLRRLTLDGCAGPGRGWEASSHVTYVIVLSYVCGT